MTVVEWPNEEQILLELRIARFDRGTDGWRTMAELAGTFECPDFGRLSLPLMALVDGGRVEERVAGNRYFGVGTPVFRAVTNDA